MESPQRSVAWNEKQDQRFIVATVTALQLNQIFSHEKKRSSKKPVAPQTVILSLLKGSLCSGAEALAQVSSAYFHPPPSARYKLTTACNCCNLSFTPLNWAANKLCSEVKTSV
jgi:hypothetical protein